MSDQILQESALAGRSPRDAALLEAHATVFRACLDTVAAWIVRSGQRRALRELAQEGRLLNDLGLTREQAFLESGNPFWRR
jgi:uncharacterized protein YjiS (DUF1127 family)